MGGFTAEALSGASSPVWIDSEDHFARLFAASPDSFVLIDPHDSLVSWPIVDCNEAACLVNGYTREELIGSSVDLLNITNGSREERAAYLARLRTEGRVSLETDHRHKDGHVFPVEVSTSLVTIGGRELVLGVDRDIGERRRAEEDLTSSHEALRRAGEDRSRLLARLITAQEDERLRLANDIHDDSIQAMTAVVFRLGVLRERADPSLGASIEGLEEAVEDAIARLRRLMFELRPPALDELGLVAALVDQASRMAQDGGLVVKLEGALEHEPAPDRRVLLFRLAQEAFANVRKHARAETVRITLGRDEGGILVRIADDGIGFSPAPREQASSPDVGHLGLISMRERAELAGGWFSVESEPGEGTVVSFWIPDPPSRGRSDDDHR
jgi:PAS domain S-box-containing protein